MTLDEAIRKQEHWAELEEQNAASWRNDPFNRVTEAEMSSEYAAEHRQLAEWLKELKAVHDEIDDVADEDEIFIGYLRQKMRGY